MPPEVLEKLLAKLDQIDPISKEDLLKSILGENNVSLDISNEIKKVISNVDALAELETERTFSKIDKKVSEDISKILSKLDLSVGSEVKNVFSKLENVLGVLGDKIQERTNILNNSLGKLNSSANSLNRLENTVRQLSQKFAISVPKIEPLKIQTEELPMARLSQNLSSEIKPSELEINLSKKSISELKKLFGGSFDSSFNGLSQNEEKNNLKLREEIKGLSGIFRGSSPLLDPFGLGSLLRLLKPMVLILGGAATAISLLAGSFGKGITGAIDTIFGTNLQKYVNVAQKIVPVQYTDFIAKWGSFIGASKFVNSQTGQKIMTQGIGTTIKEGARNMITKIPGVSSIYKATLGKAASLPPELLSQAGKYKEYLKAGFNEKEALNILKSGVREETPAIARGASKLGGNVLTNILTKLGISATEKGLQKIPFGIGALFGLGFGISRIMNGDYISGMLSIASGIAAAFPGAGTAVSFGIDALDVFLQWKAPEWKKSNNKFLWTSGLKNVPIISFFRNLGYHFENGTPWMALFDIMRLVPMPGMVSFVDQLENLIASDVNTQIKSEGKMPNFSELVKIVRKNMWKIISPHIPEMWGIKKWFASASGLSEENIKEGEIHPTNPEASPYRPLPSESKNSEEKTWNELHEGEHWVSEGKGKGKWVKNALPTVVQRSLLDMQQKGFSVDEEFNKINAPSVFENPNTDIKNYMTSLNAAVFNISSNFKDLNQTLKESGGGSPSVVSIDNSSQNNGGGENYFSGGRDHIFDWRTYATMALRGS